ncbi:MAG: 2-octaprenyl-6-methoxyphenyl hydroxylase [SAR86 cluster bacterium]|uniref:2-octaprenyl-6-methoxyphenyl hydroxylase n=1 Tax=SAR86 cluster bacterium TaxID=2030880 RepID=A0A2A5CD31_9GAMM|nr:2-octaprenyl-6-methoxyphenyl hydroxylase [Gammaproteobacteria bacterium AH-315-E17]PCJ41777.1 MAG: 2-octaprenyl-6-methoxyphenyl hydroxylase [SAR86 cluster bacterium]
MADPQHTQHDQYDVVIIGGGMVGLSLACALQNFLHKNSAKKIANKTARVLLLESKPVKIDKVLQPGFDARSTVLSYGTVQYLESLGLWDELKTKAEAIKTIHISDQSHFGSAQIKAQETIFEEAVDALGVVVENQDLGLALNKTLLGARQIEVKSPVQVNLISHQAHSALLECQSGDEIFTIKTSLVVLADGGRSGLSEKLGIHRKQKNYDQVAIIANVAFSKAHNNVAYERFTPNGPLALLPLLNHDQNYRAALVWTQNAHEYKEIIKLSDEDFLVKLQEEFGQRLGTFLKVGERAAFPLSLQEAEEQIRHNLVLLGNVAHTLHPVAGQGFNLAFRDAMRLAENISRSMDMGENPGSYSRLQEYLDSTKFDQAKTIGFSHYLPQFFSSNQQALVWLRKFGLLSVDLLPPLKQTLSNQAMGVSDRMIKLV